MADGWTHDVVCRYFKNGVCREGNNCRYLHVQGNRNDANVNNMETMSNILPSLNVTCRFFKQGVCKFGNQCHFRHNTNILDTATGHKASSSKIKEDKWVRAPEFIPPIVPPIAGSSFSTSGTNTSIEQKFNTIEKEIKNLQQKSICQEIKIEELKNENLEIKKENQEIKKENQGVKEEIKKLNVRVDAIEIGLFAKELKTKIINTIFENRNDTDKPNSINNIKSYLKNKKEYETYKIISDKLKER